MNDTKASGEGSFLGGVRELVPLQMGEDVHANQRMSI